MKKSDPNMMRRAEEQAQRWGDVEPRNNAIDQMYYTQMQRQQGMPAESVSRATQHRQSQAAAALTHLSSERQEYLKEVNARAEEGPRPNLSLAAGLQKTASSTSGSGGRLGGVSNSTHIGPEPFSPLFLTQNMQLPRDRITMNAWNRAYYETNPIVRNAINLHATYPISKLSIRCDDKRVERFFLDMCDRIDLETVVQQAAGEFWKLGESIKSGTYITLADGSVKKIEDILVGDMVLTHLGNKKMVTEKFVKPTKILKQNGIEIYRIGVEGLSDLLTISGNHPMLSINRGYFVCNTSKCSAKGMRILPDRDRCSNCKHVGIHNTKLPDFVEAKHVSIGDTVYAPFNRYSQSNYQFDEKLCYIMGQWLAEGCYCKYAHRDGALRNGIKFCSYDGDHISNTLEPLIEDVFGHAPTTYTSVRSGFSNQPYKNGGEREKYDTHLSGKKRGGYDTAAFFMEHCGEYSHEKRMSETLMQLPIDLQLHLLAGFIDGDGCIDPSNGHAILCTTSPHLANQFLIMLRRAGARPTVSKVKNKELYRVKIVANEAYALFHGRLMGGKNDKLSRSKWSSPHSAIHNGWQVLTIKTIEDITDSFNDEFMYDIEVEDDHSYVANGIAVHNCFVYASFDESTGSWDQMYLHNPDFIQVRASPVSPKNTTILLRPDPELKKIVTDSEPEYARIREQIDPKIINHVLRNEMIPLDNFNISHLKMLNSPYDVRGTSIIVSVWKDLMLYDKYRECKYIQADSMVNPITLVKVGTDGAEGFYPRQEELDNWRSIMEQAQFDRDFKIITHGAVSIERVGASGHILDTAADINQIFDNLFTGLMVPKSLITQEGSSYATASVALDVMRQRYNGFRTMIANWLERKIFAPISEVQGFYDIVGQEKRLIVPKVEWNHMTLYDLDNYIAHLSTLVEKNRVSVRTLDRSLGLSRKNEIANIRQELIEASILAKEQENLSKMSLSQLKSLNPNEPIPEPAGGAGGMPGGGLPGGGLPGVPPPPMPGMDIMGMGAGGLPPPPPELGPPSGPAPVPVEPPGGMPGAPPPPLPPV